MKLNKSSECEIVRGRVPKKMKREAVQVLDEYGLTQSEVINYLFEYIATYREIPFSKTAIISVKAE